LLVDVYFLDFESALPVVLEVLEDRILGFAGATPVCVEVPWSVTVMRSTLDCLALRIRVSHCQPIAVIDDGLMVKFYHHRTLFYR